MVAEKYKLKLADAQEWHNGVEIAAERFISQVVVPRCLFHTSLLQECSLSV